MSDSPVVEMTALDAKALRELVEGLIAANKALEARIAALEAAGHCWQVVSVPTCWPNVTAASPQTFPYGTSTMGGNAQPQWWGDPNDAPFPPPKAAN